MDVRAGFVGVDTPFRTAAGELRPRVYLDSAASSLAWRPGLSVRERILPFHANAHSDIHFGAAYMTGILEEAHARILDFFGTSPRESTAIFSGSGATSAINILSRRLGESSGGKPCLVSPMEHHSNDLPHRRHFRSIQWMPLARHPDGHGAIDAEWLREYLAGNPAAMIAVTAVSNVTGIVNDVPALARIANAFGVPILVDAAQAAAHMPISMAGADYRIDALAFSSHKVFAPGGPGILIARNSLLSSGRPALIGGGAVKSVSKSHFELSGDPFYRENPGTMDVLGIAQLAKVLGDLKALGMDRVEEHDLRLTERVIRGLREIGPVRIYGSLDGSVRRTSCVSFNVDGMPHGLVAAVLNDYYNIAVRNQCFCAHPYVKELIGPDFLRLEIEEDEMAEYVEKNRGMVRVSLGLHNTESEIDYFLDSLRDLVSKRDFYDMQYRWEGGFRHVRYAPDMDCDSLFQTAT